MFIIKNIEYSILQLDAGTFQKLCFKYLGRIKKHYNNVLLGGEAGTCKTTKGTSDGYFLKYDDKYIFMECTTQKTGLFQKIKRDIRKCLDVSKTGINHEKISEIIYCHTSSNITVNQDDELRTICESCGIKFTIIGIDKISEDLYLYNRDLVKEFLGIQVGSGQIQSYDEFVKNYNRNRISAPIDTKFLFRNEEIKKIDEAYKKNDIVVLSGVSGVGKTRLALQYAKNYSDNFNSQLYCISNKSLPLYEDLKIYLSNPGNYFIFIDDANHLSDLKHIVDYTVMKPEGYNVKILITVRNYAVQEVVKNIQEITLHKNIDINKFTDDEITFLVENELNIRNHDYKDKILRIAEGNVRIAILAGKIACEKKLRFISDVSQLFDVYFGYVEKLLVDDCMYIVAGIVAFLEVINLDFIGEFVPILQEKGLNKYKFIENIYKLHEQEIVDIYNNKVVRFSDQCLANYLLKYIFIDRKLISLHKMIKLCFPKYKENIIFSINTLCNVFANKHIVDFIEKEIRNLWDILSKENEENNIDFFEFVKVFFIFNPTKTVILLKNKIQAENKVDILKIDTETGKNCIKVDDDIIKIICGFANTDDFSIALDLFFEYYLKRSDLYIQFYHAVILYFGIKKDSEYNSYYTQIIFLEKLKKYSDNWQNKIFIEFFLDIAKEFLKVCFSYLEEGRKNTVFIHRISLGISEGVKEYRKLIWEYLLSICEIDNYKEEIKKIIQSYGEVIEKVDILVLKFDLIYIKKIMTSYFPSNDLSNCCLASHIVQVFKRIDIPCEDLFSEYFKNESYCMYSLLKGPDFCKNINYEDRKIKKYQEIKEYVSKCNLVKIKKIIDVCSEIWLNNNRIAFKISDGLGIFFELLSSSNYYVEAIKYYIKKNTPCNLNPHCLIKSLFNLLDDSEILSIINSSDYTQKKCWMYAYYYELPNEIISEKHLQGLYNFLNDNSDACIESSSLRDIDFLEKYRFIDKDVLNKSCKIILSKASYSTFMVSIYFRLLFEKNYNTPEFIIEKFRDNLEVLQEIYFVMLSYDKLIDCKGKVLKELYLLNPFVLDEYINYLINKNEYIIDNSEQYICFFELDDYIDIYNKIFDQLIENNSKFSEIFVLDFLRHVFLPIENKLKLLEQQDIWIKQCIQKFYDHKLKMYYLFNCIAELGSDRKVEYISIFIENNEKFDDFKNISLTPKELICYGSAIPMYSEFIEFLKLLISRFNKDSKWIEHKNYIEEIIEYFDKKIEYERYYNFLIKR